MLLPIVSVDMVKMSVMLLISDEEFDLDHLKFGKGMPNTLHVNVTVSDWFTIIDTGDTDTEAGSVNTIRHHIL